MLANLMFVLKTLLATLAIVFVMQINIGSRTIEQRAQFWIHSSPITHYLQQAAYGAVSLGEDLYRRVKAGIASDSGSHRHRPSSDAD